MAGVIEIYNDDFNVLINDRFKCHALAAKGAGVTVQQNVASGGQASIGYNTQSSTPPVVAVYSNELIIVEPTAIGPNYYSWRVRSMLQAPSASFEYFIFDLPDVSESAGGMVQLFNEQGELVFDSNLKYMRVIKMLWAGTNTQITKTYTPVPAGRKYAYCSGNAAYTYQRVRGPLVGNNVYQHDIDYVYFSSACQVGSTFVHGGRESYLSYSVLGPQNGLTFRRSNSNSSGMILDVTGY